jgi:hypothetical protein
VDPEGEEMGDSSEEISSKMQQGILPCGKGQKRPLTRGLSKNDFAWKEAIVIGECSRPINSIIFVAESPDPKFYYVRKKKGVGTINSNKIKLYDEGDKR